MGNNKICSKCNELKDLSLFYKDKRVKIEYNNPMFTQEEIRNLLVLISRAQITGAEASTVTELQKKLASLIEAEEKTPTESSEVAG